MIYGRMEYYAEPGARNNWHTHPGGQILIVTEGTGYYQEKASPYNSFIKEMLSKFFLAQCTGMAHLLAAGLHTLLSIPILKKGIVDWLVRVTDEEYNSFR